MNSSLFPKVVNKLFYLSKRARVNTTLYSLGSLFTARSKGKMTLDEANQNIDQLNKKTTSGAVGNNLIIGKQYSLQIIVPCYNVETYVEECLTSILNQITQYTFIVYVVNDGSTDMTMDVLNRFRNDPRVIIIDKENGGVSSARNEGLKHICADYLMFVDSDDYLPTDAIETLLNSAYKNNAEVVQGSYYGKKGNEIYPIKSFNNKLIDNRDLVGYPWGKVYKSELFQNIIFPTNLWYEDTVNHLLVHSMVQNCYSICDFVYVYRCNPSSITNQSNNDIRQFDSFIVTRVLIENLKQLGIPFTKNLYEKLLRQYVTNSIRLKTFPFQIQKSVFVIQSEQFNNLYDESVSLDTQYNELIDIMNSENFLNYYLYIQCK